MIENQNPEQKTRNTIDALLQQAGWIVQSAKKIDLKELRLRDRQETAIAKRST